MRIDVIDLSNKAKRVKFGTGTPIKEVVDRVMHQAYNRDPKYWNQAQEISNNVIKGLGANE